MQLRLPLTAARAPLSDAVVFVRHRRARRYILRVLSDGTVRVTLPRWGTTRDARGFVASNAAWVERQRARLLRRRRERPASEPAGERAARERVRRDLPAELQKLAAEHGIDVRRVSIRDQRTRWGSCSRAGSITLNWRLVLTPDFVREYVMLHELMHRRELNHSRRFWRLMAACCPRVDEARAWLRREGNTLWPDAD